jgi:hypothetical protein
MALPRFREAFDPDRDFIVRRALRLSGADVPVGATFNKTLVPTRRLRQLFNQRVLAYSDETGRDLARPPHPDLRRPPAGRRAPAVVAEPIEPAYSALDLHKAAAAADGDPDTLQERLAAEPRVARAKPSDPRDQIPIPKDWAKLVWPKRLQLASAFSTTRVVNGADAAAVLEAELARRARAA